MTPPDGGCCWCMLSSICTLGLTALFLWLSLRVSNPACFIENFGISTFNKTAIKRTMYYDLKLVNQNKDKGVYYDTLNLTFYYKPNLKIPIGSDSVRGFYQGHGKSKDIAVKGIEPKGVVWEKGVTAAVAKNGTAVFRVELVTAVRFKTMFWKTKRHHLKVGADLQVNDQGSLIKRKKNKGIKLSSGAKKIKGSFKLLSALGAFILIHFS